MFIPKSILKKLYTKGSMYIADGILHFELKNRLKASTLASVDGIRINGQNVELGQISMPQTESLTIAEFNTAQQAIELPLGMALAFTVPCVQIDSPVSLEVTLTLDPIGNVTVEAKDSLRDQSVKEDQIPRDSDDNLNQSIIRERQDYLREKCESDAPTLFDYRGPTDVFDGNIENFIGAAQVPVGIAGPVNVLGEHAKGEFYVPLATTEGTLVASYSRGMKLINQCGGAKVRVFESLMQRAPVFIFSDSGKARDFLEWVTADEQIEAIRQHAEATDPFIKFTKIDPYTANKFVFVRFNFETGDAAGQNMTGQATYAACNWILSAYPDVENFYLESNMATDKKASQINTMHTRGKRVTAEVVLKKEALMEVMHVDPAQIDYHARVASIGGFLSGVNNNGLHAANGIAALFIATGQDAANVAESSTGILYTEPTPEGDLYISLTLPSLIVATYGGGTGLPTQQECLKLMGCTGKGSVTKLAEIAAVTALAGEISLASAISSLDWVSSHEQYGRNR